jgi:hypothetical protein
LKRAEGGEAPIGGEAAEGSGDPPGAAPPGAAGYRGPRAPRDARREERGHLPPSAGLDRCVDYYDVSPKLSNAGVKAPPPPLRHKPQGVV